MNANDDVRKNGISAHTHDTQGSGNVGRANKPEREDVSRWENEGGNPPPVREVEHLRTGEMLQARIERLLREQRVNLESVKQRVETEVRAHPLVAVGVASAVGFIVGGGFRSKKGRQMIKRAIEYGLDQFESVRP